MDASLITQFHTIFVNWIGTANFDTLIKPMFQALVIWGGLRIINLSKRNTKLSILWMIVRQGFRWMLSGEETKKRVKAKFHDMCHKTWLGRVLGSVSDATLDLWIEDAYIKIKTELEQNNPKALKSVDGISPMGGTSLPPASVTGGSK